MKKALFVTLLLFPLLLAAQSNKETQKVLMVLSSYGKDMGQTRPGFEFDEFSQAYLIFKQNNLEVELASPRGGKLQADRFDKEKPYNKAVMEDQSVATLLENTQPTASVDPNEFDAIYVVGGKGAMFDLPFDPALQDIILNLYQREGTVIASVCHGPAAFVNVKDGDRYIIEGQQLTGFCNMEEELFGKKWVKEFPFKLEDKLGSRGAVFSQADFMLSHVAVSGKFVTGQNPFSTTASASEVVKALGVTPATRSLYADERTILTIQQILANQITPAQAQAQLKADTQLYDIPLMAVYGYYKILAAKEDTTQLKIAVSLIELTAPYYFNENLQLVLARTYITLDQKEKARAILNELDKKGLLKEKVAQLLEELG